MKIRLTAVIAVSALALLIQGCKPFHKNQPSNEQITAAISTDMPPYVSVAALVPEFIPGATDKEWSINVKVSIAPKEDLLSYPSRGEANSINELIEQNNELVDWRNRFVQGKANEDLAGISTSMGILNAPQPLRVSQARNQPIAVYGKMTAEWQVDRWRFTTHLELPEIGKPLSTFRDGNTEYLVTGTPAGEEMLQKLRKKIEVNQAKKKEMIATVERIAKEKTEKIAAEKKARMEKIQSRFTAGTKFKAPYQLNGRTITAIIEILSYDKRGNIFDVVAYDEANPKFKKTYLGKLPRDRDDELTDQNIEISATGKEGPLPAGMNTPGLFEATETLLRFNYSEADDGLKGGTANMFKKEDIMFQRLEPKANP